MENITVIGIGKLGLGFALMLEKSGYNVLGVDINEEYVAKINSKKFICNEPKYNDLLQSCQNFKATTNLSDGLNHSDILFIIVQTPNSGGDKFYDHSILSNLLVKINNLKPMNKDIIIGCTVMPKYIDEIGNTLISDCRNCYLSYNPEFVAQGDIIYGFKNPDIILLGTTHEELKPIIENIYKKMCDNSPKFCLLTPLEAEITKISINGFITTKIAYANMISDLCDTLNANKNVVLNSIGSDSRIGTKYFKPGYSFGGPCFPRDTRALNQLMKQNNIFSGILENTTISNNWHTDYQTQRLLDENKDTYIFDNVCYKEKSKIPIIEESAKLKIAKNLHKIGKTVIIRDIEETINEVKKEYGNIFTYNIINSIESFSDCGQDIFAQNILNGKRNGTYLDLGCRGPIKSNNTYTFEKNFEFTGLSFDIDFEEILTWKQTDRNYDNAICCDLLTFDIENKMDEFYSSTIIDYLTFDLEPPLTTLEVLRRIPFNKYKFRVITYEHDYYRGFDTVKPSREIFKKHGYRKIKKSYMEYIINTKECVQRGTCIWLAEDWWIHPDIISVPEEILDSEVSDVNI